MLGKEILLAISKFGSPSYRNREAEFINLNAVRTECEENFSSDTIRERFRDICSACQIDVSFFGALFMVAKGHYVVPPRRHLYCGVSVLHNLRTSKREKIYEICPRE